MLKADAVFEGGGIKGIGLVGALNCLEDKGYEWQRIAGTSAGAMVGAMVAAGYKAKEIRLLINNLNYKEYIDKDGLAKIPMLGKPLSLFIDKGILSGNSVEKWLKDILKAKGVVTFKDVSHNGESRLKIIAADITKKRLLILPDDLIKYKINPMEFEVAKAVRMSISLPFLFEPVKLKNEDGFSYIVDGGVLSNYPIWIFDVANKPRWPTFGFKLVEPENSKTSLGKKDIVSFAIDIISTMLDKNEEMYIRDKDLVRTIPIPTLGIKTTEFNLTKQKRSELFNSGYNAGMKFIEKWNYDKYVRNYRT